MKRVGPTQLPPHGIALPVAWKRVIDGDTIEAILPSGRIVNLRIEGFDAPELPDSRGIAAKHALESLLESTAALGLTAFVPLPEDADNNGRLDLDEMFRALSFERVRAWLFAGAERVDAWMFEHGHAAEKQ